MNMLCAAGSSCLFNNLLEARASGWEGTHRAQDFLERPAPFRIKLPLRQEGRTHGKSLHLEPRLDARSQGIPLEGHVEGPLLFLKSRRFFPTALPGCFVQGNALLGNDAGGTGHPADATDEKHEQGNGRGIAEELDPVAEGRDDGHEFAHVPRRILKVLDIRFLGERPERLDGKIPVLEFRIRIQR